MKQKNTLYTVILVFATLFTSWTVPALVRKMTDDSKSYPLLYYSARLKELCILDFREMKDAFKISTEMFIRVRSTIRCCRL